MKTTFFSMVMNNFQYLVDEYSFAVIKTENSEHNPEIEGRIEFETTTTFVTVSSEQWAVGAAVGRVKDDKYRFFLNPATIHEYIILTESDKKLVCSLDAKDNSNSVIEDINSQLADYSRWLHQYAEPFLRGDFSQWLELYEYKVIRSRAAHIRSGKEEFVRTIGQNKDERISIFQSSLDYLEKLREEYGKK